MKTTIRLCTTFLLLCGTSNLFAQNVTVQQPVFRNFSVNTTVSVPDRGSIHLGSVSRAVSGTKNVGLLYRPNSAVATFHEHAGASAHVYIHDFAAMDEYLLNQGTPGPDVSSSLSNGKASSAFYSLYGRRRPLSNTRPTFITRDVKKRETKKASKVIRSLQLAERAEKQGKASLAKLHYRIAAKYGSATAKNRLAKLDEQKGSLYSIRK